VESTNNSENHLNRIAMLFEQLIKPFPNKTPLENKAINNKLYMQLTTDQVLTRGVEQILPTKEGLAKLMESRKITLYQGFDPTSPALHIGHLIGIRKLAQFQKLGHQVIFLIDFTEGSATRR
jgi:hypothetical protein